MALGRLASRLLVLLAVPAACGGRVGASAPPDPSPVGAEAGTSALRAACTSTDGGASPVEPRFCTADGTLGTPAHPSSARNSVSGRVFSMEPDQLGHTCPGLAGVEVCLFLNNSVCTTTEADGSYVLLGPQVLPGDAGPLDQELTFTKAGYQPVLQHVSLGPPVIAVGLVMSTRAMWDRTRDCAGASSDPGLGMAWIYALSSASGVGITISLTPEGGEGPFYLTWGGDKAKQFGFNPALHALDGPSGALWFDLDPRDDYVMHFSTDDGRDLTDRCIGQDGTGWGTARDGQKLKIRTGLLSRVGAFCVPPPR